MVAGMNAKAVGLDVTASDFGDDTLISTRSGACDVAPAQAKASKDRQKGSK